MYISEQSLGTLFKTPQRARLENLLKLMKLTEMYHNTVLITHFLEIFKVFLLINYTDRKFVSKILLYFSENSILYAKLCGGFPGNFGEMLSISDKVCMRAGQD